MTGSAQGSVEAFRKSWRERDETSYVHWTRGEPINQIQLAFRQHWLTFKQLMADVWPDGPPRKRVVEIGAGRGTLSMYFADDGWECTLVDASDEALDRAGHAFADHGLRANCLVGDATALELPSDAFEVAFSIGLLEHFEDPTEVFTEHVRVVTPGGVVFAYVVPDAVPTIQVENDWVNQLLRVYVDADEGSGKEDVYRSAYGPERYEDIARAAGLSSVRSCGLYPLPMVSPSPEFPFTLNPPAAELMLVERFQLLLAEREAITGASGWFCDAADGQAFLVWGTK